MLLATIAGVAHRPPATHAMFRAYADPLPQIRVLRSEGRLAEALELATQAIRDEPERRELRMERGFLLAVLRRYDEALAEYDVVLADNPGDLEALLEHAQVKTLQTKYDEAEGEFRYILALAPGLPGAAFGLGDVLTWKGDLVGAKAAYLDYVQSRPDDPRGHLRLGNVAVLARDAEEARARFREALRLDPASAEARAGLERADRLVARDLRFRLDLGYTHETLTRGEPDWRQATASLLFRLRPGTQFHVSAQHVNRFSRNDQLVSLGFTQRLSQNFTLSGSFGQGLEGRVLPKQIYEGQLAVHPRGPLQLFTSYQFSDFNPTFDASTVSPGIQLTLPWRLSVLGRYFRTRSTGNESANAFYVLVWHETTPQFQPYVGFSHGGLAARAQTAEEFRTANSQYNSAFVGFSWRLFRRVGIRADYAYQTVKDVYVKQTFGLTTFVEF